MDNTAHSKGDTLISDLCVAAMLGCSRPTVWRRAKDGTIPKPIKVGGMTRWSRSEIQGVITDALAARDGEAPARRAAQLDAQRNGAAEMDDRRADTQHKVEAKEAAAAERRAEAKRALESKAATPPRRA